jgi:phosphoserine aminotransferase
MKKPYNFFSGPAILPEEVLEQAAAAIRDFAGTRLSVLEISHRSKAFVDVMNEARFLAKSLLQLSSDFEILFLQGGASLQFLMVPLNLLSRHQKAAYFDTGHWSNRAIEEAKKIGQVEVIASSGNANYSYIPKEWITSGQLSHSDYAYVHITTNNTVFGTQWSSDLLEELFAQTHVPIVADMSSDIFSRQLDFNRFGIIYAGAQKNMGPAGVTMVAINKNLLQDKSDQIPTLLNYRQQIQAESMLNTPSVFAVYVAWLTLKWIEKKGLPAIENMNEQKASLLYEAIDSSSIFSGTVAKEDRSKMNVCFKTESKETDERFLAHAEANGLIGLAGYRTVGGCRASIYNAMPLEGVQQLISCMRQFEAKIK